MACGAGTIYRNYFVEVNGEVGQTTGAQLDCLDAVGLHPFPDGPRPWTMRNGYALFEPFARLVLDAAYEATLRSALLNAAETGNRTVYLTLVGGGVFGNEEPWIIDAIGGACRSLADAGLDVAIVSYRTSSPAVAALVRSF